MNSTTLEMRREWRELLLPEFERPYMRDLIAFLRSEIAAGKVIYPPEARIFAALNATPPSKVKVIIIGQDPYHGPGQAQGLAFSVQRGLPIPPSLRNIFHESRRDLGTTVPAHGDLSYWAEQGVLLLNTVLTVEQGKPGSHQGRGWERFTDRIIEVVAGDPVPKVFLLWGAHARKKGAGIDQRLHCVLTAPHPSPLSAYRGFIGCGHFGAANRFLAENQRGVIDWQIPE